MKRYNCNPIFKPEDVIPTRGDFKVDGIFNCGAIKKGDEYILLCRVAESFKNDNDNLVLIPIVENNNGVDEIKKITINKKENPQYIYTDSRSLWTNINGKRKIEYLTSLSHFRIARSLDGYNFVLDKHATIFPKGNEEQWGIEDPRITKIDSKFYITYTSVSRYGAATSLMVTEDFITFNRKCIIFAPENKDVTLFPQKINGQYFAFNRPVPSAIGGPDMWIAKSDNLIHWGEQVHFYAVASDDSWENGRIGGGAVPFLTKKGWIKIYHAADKNDRYCLGAFLLDKNNPTKILGKTNKPILEPDEVYEKEGFFSNVVFTCGVIIDGNNIKVYYGAADDKICLAEYDLGELLEAITIF